MIFGLWVPSYELSTSSKPFYKLDSQSHDISILIFEIQVKMTITCFLKGLLVEKKHRNVDRGTFIYSFGMVNMISDDKLVKNKQINLIIRIITHLVI